MGVPEKQKGGTSGPGSLNLLLQLVKSCGKAGYCREVKRMSRNQLDMPGPGWRKLAVNQGCGQLLERLTH